MEKPPIQNPNPKSPIPIRLLLSNSTHTSAEKIFRYFDINSDGLISPSELRIRLTTFSPNEAAAIVESLDSDGDGFLSLEDLERVMAAEEVSEVEREEELREAFSMYEMEGRGCITAKSLRKMMRKLGEYRSVGDCRKMIRRFDVDGDGVLSFEEFVEMMR